MNNRQIAKYGMFHLVLSFCARSIDIIKSVPAFNHAFNTFEGLVRAIDTVAPQAVRKITGPAAAKRLSRQNLQAQTLAISSLLYAFASEKNDVALKEKVNYTERELDRKSNEEVTPACIVVLETAREKLAEMTDYNLTQAMLNDLSVAIDKYKSDVPNPKLEFNTVRGAKSRFNTLLSEADEVLKERMDQIVASLKKTEPDFYKMYRDNRKLTNPSTKHTRVSGNVTDKTTGEGLAGVTVAHQLTGLQTVTGASGEYILRIPLTGNHEVTFFKEGFKPDTRTVELKLGQKTQLEIMLVPA